MAKTFLNGEDIIYEIYLIVYKFPTNNNGIYVAIEILIKFPSARILFITGYEHLQNEISKNPIFMVGRLSEALFL